VLQRVDLRWGAGLASAMPSLMTGLRKNTSLFRFHVGGCAPDLAPPTSEQTARYDGGWMQEMKCLGYRNFIRTPEETHRPRGIWPHALAQVATYPDVIYEALHSRPALVSSGKTEGGSCLTLFRSFIRAVVEKMIRTVTTMAKTCRWPRRAIGNRGIADVILATTAGETWVRRESREGFRPPWK
jgi:hypothetical protein